MNKKLRASLLAVFFAACTSITMSGCSDDDIDELANDPPAACEAVIDRICDWLAPCSSGVSYDECVVSSEAGLPGRCSQAVAVSRTFEECMSDLDARTCSNTTLPASCTGVILFP
jgi:hypothetical protein